MARLTKEQKEVWDRLKNGLPKKVQQEFEFGPNYSVEDEMVKIMSQQIANEIDQKILNEILKTYSKQINKTP